MPEHLIIVGGGQAAAQAAQTAREHDFAGRVSLIGEEACLPYQRPPLSKKFLTGEIPPERLALKPETFYRAREIDLRLGASVTSLDCGASRLRLDDGAALEYSHLILATGSAPRHLRVPGVGLPGIHYLRSVADARTIRQELEAGKRLAVIGAGFIGLELAAVAVSAGLDVVVLEAGDRVMARSVGPQIAAYYASRHRLAGVDLRFGAEVAEFRGDASVRSLETAAGERIDCDLAVIAIGIEPRVELAANAGLAIENGIRVDAHGRASAPGVFAAGDCASHPHPWAGRRIRLESVQNAIEQAKAAAATAAGHELAFDTVPWFWSDQYDLKLQIAGLSQAYASTVLRGDPDSGSFSVYYLDRHGRAIAVDAVNDPKTFIAARKLLATKPRLPPDAIADLDCDLSELTGRGG